MLFNNTYKLDKLLRPLTQDEIIATPHYHAMSLEQITNHHTCPDHLRSILLSLPWTGRPNFIQVRIQDCRHSVAPITGSFWHSDFNTQLANGKMHVAKDPYEFRSMTASFGDVTEAEFIRDPFESNADPFNLAAFAHLDMPTVQAFPEQLCIYTSLDIHRASPKVRPGNARLMFVTVECDAPLPLGSGLVKPPLRDKR